jgi:hypothetical protein
MAIFIRDSLIRWRVFPLALFRTDVMRQKLCVLDGQRLQGFRRVCQGVLRFSLPSALTCGTLEFELNDEFKVDFWNRFSGLVWSNSNAGDSVRIRAALLNPKFHVLLAIAVEFGCERLIEEWRILQADPLTDTSGVALSVNRILKNILRGYQQACS